jgi:hypothetical protein
MPTRRKPNAAEYQICRPGLEPLHLQLRGRPAWCLARLIEAGSAGLTAAELPAGLRVSGYILKLRRQGIEIGTTYEPNSGEFGGSHARYRLTSEIQQIHSGGVLS